MVSYTYDAWGNILEETVHNTAPDAQTTVVHNIATHNPFKYKGYIHDEETGFYYLKSRYYNPDIGRFISPDSINYIDPTSFEGLNLFAYCGNNPVTRYDPNGHFWDYVLDAAFIIWGVYDLVNGGYKDWKNWLALGIDVVFAVVPYVTSGLGQVIKVGNKIDDAIDVVSAINKIDNIHDISKVTMIGRDMDRVKDAAKLIGKLGNVYTAWEGYDLASKGIKRVLHNSISVAHNTCWIFEKLRSGYTIIDIGVKSYHTGRGLWYGAERLVIGLWQTRNIWKFFFNFN